MNASSFFKIVALVTMLAPTVLHAQSDNAADADGDWATRTQIIYDVANKSVIRRTLRVWDAEPAKNLEFVWEPAPGETPHIADDGAVSGAGKLTWRVRGSASYDPRTVYSTYEGELRGGRIHGNGRLEARSGEILEGTFVNGRLEGKGVRIGADGSRYEGNFLNGVASGQGKLAFRTGEIYVGPFAGGLRHGHGRTILAGGTSYESEWSRGRELGAARNTVADATLGGLLKAQSGGGDAGKVEIGIQIDQRMTQQADMRYTQFAGDEAIELYPEDEQMNQAWRGDGEVTAGDYYITGIDWEDTPAFVEVDLSTGSNGRAKLDSMELRVKESVAYRKPMLTLLDHVGCVGFRPSFSIKNNGWGEARNVKVALQFAGEDPANGTSRSFPVSVPDIADGADVSIEAALSEAGVDVAALARERFSCQSRESLAVCRSQVFNSVGFGEIADYVWGDDKLGTTAVGRIDYDWADDFGNSYHQSEPFRVNIALSTIELPEDLAECGDGFGGAPDAPRYQDVHLPVNQSNYAIEMPVRGNKNIKSYHANLKLRADMTSYHDFNVAARFADGSERLSKAIRLYYFRPKPSGFVTSMEPAQCYLPPSSSGC
ncbi:MAG: hypothetical protein R3D70_18930 [Rhizobiaceae bacterium]